MRQFLVAFGRAHGFLREDGTSVPDVDFVQPCVSRFGEVCKVDSSVTWKSGNYFHEQPLVSCSHLFVLRAFSAEEFSNPRLLTASIFYVKGETRILRSTTTCFSSSGHARRQLRQWQVLYWFRWSRCTLAVFPELSTCRHAQGEKCAQSMLRLSCFTRNSGYFFYEPLASGRHFQQSGRCASVFFGSPRRGVLRRRGLGEWRGRRESGLPSDLPPFSLSTDVAIQGVNIHITFLSPCPKQQQPQLLLLLYHYYYYQQLHTQIPNRHNTEAGTGRATRVGGRGGRRGEGCRSRGHKAT